MRGGWTGPARRLSSRGSESADEGSKSAGGSRRHSPGNLARCCSISTVCLRKPRGCTQRRGRMGRGRKCSPNIWSDTQGGRAARNRALTSRGTAGGARSFLASCGIALPEGSPTSAVHKPLRTGEPQGRVLSRFGAGARRARFPARHCADVTGVAAGLKGAMVSSSKSFRDAGGVGQYVDTMVDGQETGHPGLEGRSVREAFAEVARRLAVGPRPATGIQGAILGCRPAKNLVSDLFQRSIGWATARSCNRMAQTRWTGG